MMPALFVSHGAPTLPLEDSPTRFFLEGLAATLPRPTAILAVSAHWDSPRPQVGGAVRPETIHDFYGFPPALYAMRYDAPGAPALARRVADLTGAAIDPDHGLDHGAWVPLRLIYPAADIPVTQLSIQADQPPAYHWALGQALRPLREDGVLILASGSITHNLREWRGPARDGATPAWVSEFSDWVAEKAEAGDREALLDYRRLAPHAQRSHPTDEHFLPLFVALGAGDRSERIHASISHGVLAMDAYLSR